MSRQVDERVVKMEFDNKNFENNVGTTMSTLEKLKQGLKFEGAAEGIKNVAGSVKDFSMDSMYGAVDKVKVSFSTLEVAAFTAIQNIANAAFEYGKNIVKSLSVDQVIAGYQEYELKMGSIQTIMASTGAPLSEVNAKLQDLNEYADRTIYSFSDMTSNIGKFTNAGVSLDRSVDAIQGVSNVAAVSGANAQQASHAMYNFAQALSAGSVKLTDWKSIETSNMATVEFKNELIKSAVAAGTLAETSDGMYEVLSTNSKGATMDGAISATKMFNESLSYQWMTTDVLIDTLGRYSDETTEIGKKAFSAAQDVKTITQLMDTLQEAAGSGWALTFEYIVGDFEEAKALLSDVSNVVGGYIDDMSDRRNEMVKGWKDLGGRTELIEALKTLFENIGRIIKPIKEAFREIFPPTTSEQLYNLTVRFGEFVEKLRASDETVNNIKRTFKGFFALIDIGKRIFGFLIDVVKEVIKVFAGPLGDGLLGVTGGVGDVIVKFRDWMIESGVLQTALEKVSDVLKWLKDKLDIVIGAFKLFYDKAVEVAKEILPPFDEVKEKVTEVFNTISPYVEDFVKGAKEGISSFVDNFKDNSKSLDESSINIRGAFDRIKEGISNAFGKIGEFLGGAWKTIKEVFGKIFEFLGQVLQKVDLTSLFAFVSMLFSGGIFVKVSKLISTVKSIGTSFTDVLNSVKDVLKSYQKTLKAKALKQIAIAVGILAASVIAVSFINPERTLSAVSAIGALMAMLVIATKQLGKISSDGSLNPETFGSLNTQLIALSIAMSLLANAVRKLGALSWGELAKGLIGVAAMMGMMAIAMKSLSKSSSNNDDEKIAKTAAKFLVLSMALNKMAKVVKKLGALSWGELAKGLGGMAIILLEVAVAVKVFDGMNTLESTAGVILVAKAMRMLVRPIKKLGQIPILDLAKGLVAMSVSLAAITIAMKNIPKEGMAEAGFAFIEIALALKVLSSIIKKLGALDLASLAKGVGAIAVTILSLALSFKIIGDVNALEIGGGIALIAIAMTIFSKSIRKFGKMRIGELAKGLIALAVAFGIVVVAIYALKPVAEVLIDLGLGMAAFGLGVNLVGVGIAAISVGFYAMAKAGEGAAKAVVAVFAAIISTIPTFLGTIRDSIPIVAEIIVVLIKSVLEGIREIADDIATNFFELIVQSLENLKEYIPEIISILLDIVIMILEKLEEKIPEIVEVGTRIVVKIIRAVIETLESMDVDIDSVIESIDGFSTILLKVAAAVLILQDVSFVGAIKAVAAFAIFIGGLTAVLIALGAINQIPGVQWLVDEGGDLLASIGTAIGKFVGSIISGFGEGLTNGLPKIANNLSKFMKSLKPFILGTRYINESSLSGVQNLAEIVLILTAASLVDAVAGMFGAKKSFADFGEELLEFAEPFKEYASLMTGINNDTVTSSSNAAKTLAEFAATVPNKGGVLSKLVGENSITEFSKELVKFAPNFVKYAKTIQDGKINVDVITASSTAASSLATLASELPNSGGLAGTILGDNDLSDFGAMLPGFGEALSDYSKAVKYIDADAISASATVGTLMSDLATSLPNSGGVVSWFTGDNDIATFGEKLPVFGEGIKEFSTSVQGLTVDSIQPAIDAIGIVLPVFNDLPRSDNLISWFKGDTTMSLTSVGNELASFGPKFSEFVESVNGISVDAVKSAADAMSAIIPVFNDLPQSDNLVSWFKGDTTMSLTSIGKELASFGPKFSEFAEDVAGISAEAMTTAASAISEILPVFNDLPQSDGLAQWITGTGSVSLTDVGEELVGFAPNFVDFAGQVSGLDTSGIGPAVDATSKVLDVMSKLPPNDGLVQWMTGTGTMSLTTLGKELASFGPKMVDFGNKISELNTEAVESSKTSLEIVTAFANNLPESKGKIATWFDGGGQLTLFGKDLVAFAPLLVEFGNTVADLNTSAAEKAVTVANSIAGIEQNLPEYEGRITTWFSGGTSFQQFGQDLVHLGEGISSFNEYAKDINQDTINAAISTAKAVAGLEENLPTSKNGIQGFFDGKVNLSEFAGQIKDLGKGISKFSESVADISIVNVTAAVSALNSLVDLAIRTEDVDTDSVSSFTSSLKKLGTDGVKGFSESISTASTTEIPTAVTNMITKFTDNFTAKMTAAQATLITSFKTSISKVGTDGGVAAKEAGSAIVDRLAEGIGNKTSTLKTKLGSVIDSALLIVVNKASSIKTKGGNIISKLAEGMSGKKETLSKKITGLLDSALLDVSGYKSKFKTKGSDLIGAITDGVGSKSVTGFKTALSDAAKGLDTTYYWKFYNIGSYVATGLADGISAYSYKPINKAINMLDSVTKAAKGKVKVESPSKVFHAIGKYIVEGLANGISDYADLAESSSEEMADQLVESLRFALNYINSIADEDFNYSPVITPVIDLEEFSKGADQINALESKRMSMSVSSKISEGEVNGQAITIQNGILSAINKLNDTVGSGVNNQIVIENLSVRNDNDIEQIANRLYQLQMRERRGSFI